MTKCRRVGSRLGPALRLLGNGPRIRATDREMTSDNLLPARSEVARRGRTLRRLQ